MDHNSNIKSMKLYNKVDRIYNELKELGRTDSDPLHVDEFGATQALTIEGTYSIVKDRFVYILAGIATIVGLLAVFL